MISWFRYKLGVDGLYILLNVLAISATVVVNAFIRVTPFFRYDMELNFILRYIYLGFGVAAEFLALLLIIYPMNLLLIYGVYRLGGIHSLRYLLLFYLTLLLNDISVVVNILYGITITPQYLLLYIFLYLALIGAFKPYYMEIFRRLRGGYKMESRRVESTA